RADRLRQSLLPDPHQCGGRHGAGSRARHRARDGDQGRCAAMSADPSTPYANLTPDTVLSAVAALGLDCDGRLLALNSYENRVYRIGIHGNTPVVAKFYRPDRWSDAAIVEEHAFTLELADADLDVVPPMRIDGNTLHRHAGYRLAVFPSVGGRAP